LALKLWHDEGNEVLQAARQGGRHEVEAVGCAGGEAVFHHVDDLFRAAAHEEMPACT
jgi:hypothetical protein